MKRLLFLPIILVVVFGSYSADSIIQPTSYPPRAQAALQSGIDALLQILGSGYPVTRRQLENRGWDEADFIRFVAGTLDSSGYRVNIVSVDDWNGEPHRFILVGIDLGDDGIAWIPVEADPSFLNSFWLLGVIPWADEGSMLLDPHYLSYDRLLEEVKVVPLDISLITPAAPLIDSPAAITVNARGRSIIAYQWSIDELGGRAQAEGTFDVLEKRHQCHCSNP